MARVKFKCIMRCSGLKSSYREKSLLSQLHPLRCCFCIHLMLFVERKCWIFNVGYTFLQGTLQKSRQAGSRLLCSIIVLLFCVKRRVNLSHMIKVSAQIFARGCKRRIQLGKALYRFLDFIKRKYFTLCFTFFLECFGNSLISITDYRQEATLPWLR